MTVDPIRTRLLLVSLLVLTGGLFAPVLAATGADGEPVELGLGEPLERQVSSTFEHRYTLDLAAGDYLEVEVLQQGVDVMVRLFGPGGELLGEFDSPTGANAPEIVSTLVDAGGRHGLTVSPFEPPESPASYRIELQRHLTTAERLAPPVEPESPRLQRLAERLEAGGEGALEEFWERVAEEGTPLIEPLPESPDERLVTFLHRGGELENVYLISEVEPSRSNGPLHRLEGTDLWFRSYRIPSDARFTYQLSPNDSRLPMYAVDWDDPAAVRMRGTTFQPDPLNPRQFPDDPNVPANYRVSVVTMPDAAPESRTEPDGSIPSGEVVRDQYVSEILDNRRAVFLYTPPGYDPERREPYDLLVLTGGYSYAVGIPTPTILDHLLAEGRIRPTVAVMIDSPGVAVRNVELACHDPYTEFLIEEMMPWIRQRFHVTDDPSRVTIGGFSFGGLAATCAALDHPDVFGQVISQSGSFWWAPEGDDEGEWLTRRIARTETRPVDFFVEVGIFEPGPKASFGASQLVANRHLRDILVAKGYDHVYREYPGDHQSTSWRVTLADALIHFLGPPSD